MASRDAGLTERLGYHLDNLLTWHPVAKLGALALLSALVMVGGGAFIWLLVPDLPGEESVWNSYTYLVDPGTHVAVEGWGHRIVGVLVTLAGLLFFALLIGLVSDGLGERMDELRRGRSRVLEEGHVLVLGWSDKVLPLIRELAVANESAGGGVVVVLSGMEKQEMEASIAEGVPELRGTRVVCRSGQPTHVADLRKVAAQHARAIVVLGEDLEPDAADAHVVRVTLAVCRGLGELSGHVVVEVQDVDNRHLVELAGGDAVEAMVPHDLIGRLMIQCARQPGLAQVYASLLGFDDQEFYLARHPELAGQPYGTIRRRVRHGIVCGMRSGDGELHLNPSDDHVLDPSGELVVLAEDDDTFHFGDAMHTEPGDLPAWDPPQPRKERVLFCGWRRDIGDMISELDAYVAAGSELVVLAEVEVPQRLADLSARGVDPANLRLTHVVGNPILRRDLASVGVESFDSVLILAGERWERSGEDSDSRSLVSLLLVRAMQEQRGTHDSVLISEICDPRTKRLVSVARASDYVVSDELVSMALSHVAERRELRAVWDDLFDAEGVELYLRPIEHYVVPGESLSWAALAERARRHDETALGYREAGVVEAVLNPAHDTRRSWAAGEQLVVIAQQ